MVAPKSQKGRVEKEKGEILEVQKTLADVLGYFFQFRYIYLYVVLVIAPKLAFMFSIDFYSI